MKSMDAHGAKNRVQTKNGIGNGMCFAFDWILCCAMTELS